MNISISRDKLVRRGALGSAAMVAIFILCVFYSIVAGAVDRASQRRATSGGAATVPMPLPVRPAPRVGVPNPGNAMSRAPAFGARTVALVRLLN